MDSRLYNIKFEDVDFSYHCLDRMKKRGVSFEDVQEAIENPARMHPQLKSKNKVIYANKKTVILIALAKDRLVEVSTWKNSPGYIKSKLRQSKNQYRRQNNFAAKRKRLKHGSKANNKRPRNNIS